MQFQLTQRINRPSDAVWAVLAEDFVNISKWHDGVKKSYALDGATALPGAPVAGRVCEFTDRPGGPAADERILEFDASAQRLVIDVAPRNVPVITPVKWSKTAFTLREVAQDTTEVLADLDIGIKPHGYLAYPLLKRGLMKQFQFLLDSLKLRMEA